MSAEELSEIRTQVLVLDVKAPHMSTLRDVVLRDDYWTLFLETRLGWARCRGGFRENICPGARRQDCVCWAREEVPYYCEQNCSELKPNHGR